MYTGIIITHRIDKLVEIGILRKLIKVIFQAERFSLFQNKPQYANNLSYVVGTGS